MTVFIRDSARPAIERVSHQLGANVVPSRHRAVWRALVLALTAVLLIPVAAGLLGVLAPTLGYGFGGAGAGASPVSALLAEPGLSRSVALSVGSALVSTALSVVLTALILAAAFGSRALAACERLLAPILAVPHAAAALGIVFLVAPSGFILRLISPELTGFTRPPDLLLLQDPWAISLTAALVLKETPFLFLMALAGLTQVQPSERVGLTRNLGYGRMAAFLFAVWPLVYRQLRLPILAVLAFSVSVVDMALILGPTSPAPLAVRVLELSQSADLARWQVGSAAALLLTLLILILGAIWLGIERMIAMLWRGIQLSGRRFTGDGLVRVAVLSLAALATVFAFTGFGGLILQSVAGYWPFPQVFPASFGWSAWERLFTSAPPRDVLINTAVIAVTATLIALPVAALMLQAGTRGIAIPALIYAPLVVPQMAFLFGLNVLAIGMDITPGWFVVALVHVLFVLPYALIALSGAWLALDRNYELVAAAAGVSATRRFVLARLPMMVPQLSVSAALCIAVSVGLYLPTQLIGAGRVPTVTTEAVTLAAGGDRRLIGLWATLQLLFPLVAFSVARAGPAFVFRYRSGMRQHRVAV